MPDLTAINTLPSNNHTALTKADGNTESRIQNPKLLRAARDMESYFVGELLKKMHESAAKGGLFEQKSETATYREMFDDAVAAEIGKRGAFGIADMLYRELSVSLNASPEAEGEKKTP